MKHRFGWALAANAALILSAGLYRGGAVIMIGMLPALHILLFMLDSAVVENRKQVVALGTTHILATFATHELWSRLYFANVCDDVAGRAIASGICLIGVVWTGLLLLIMLIRFNIKLKREFPQQEVQPSSEPGTEKPSRGC